MEKDKKEQFVVELIELLDHYQLFGESDNVFCDNKIYGISHPMGSIPEPNGEIVIFDSSNQPEDLYEWGAKIVKGQHSAGFPIMITVSDEETYRKVTAKYKQYFQSIGFEEPEEHLTAVATLITRNGDLFSYQRYCENSEDLMDCDEEIKGGFSDIMNEKEFKYMFSDIINYYGGKMVREKFCKLMWPDYYQKYELKPFADKAEEEEILDSFNRWFGQYIWSKFQDLLDKYNLKLIGKDFYWCFIEKEEV